MKSSMSTGRKAQPSAPRVRHSVLLVNQALRVLATATALQFAVPAVALDYNATTVYGTVKPSYPDAKTLQLDQTTQTAIQNITVLNTIAGDRINIVQPNASALYVGRGVGNRPFSLDGNLTANGQVFLVNQLGVILGPNSTVSAASFVGSTLDISNENILTGNYVFARNGTAGSVTNQGTITITAPFGYAALIGPQVSNTGFISAKMGTVALAAGDRVALDMVGDGLISVRVEQAALGAAAINSGTIQAAGGQVILAARSADALLDTVINNTGIIRANSLVERNGTIVLDGGSAGVVANSGTLDVSGVDAGTTGGTVKVLGDKVALLDGTRINASGDAGGGTVLVGGNLHGAGPEQNATATFVGTNTSIDASAVNTGNGGTVAVWSDGATSVHGAIAARGGAQSGNGGLVETSGKSLDVRGVRVDTRAPQGSAAVMRRVSAVSRARACSAKAA